MNNNYIIEQFLDTIVIENGISKIILHYKFIFDNDCLELPFISAYDFNKRFITFFNMHYLKTSFIYPYSWDSQMSYRNTGHDIRTSFALFTNDEINIRKLIGEKKFELLLDVPDENSVLLKNSNHYYRNYID